jgi:hypothetical protein
MKIRNETRLDTRNLRTLILQVAGHEQWSDQYKRMLVVRVLPRRRNARLWGRAPYNAIYFRLFLREGDDSRQIARVVAHEAAHNMGLTHRMMPKSYFYGGQPETWEWAAQFPVATRPLAVKAKPRVDAKLAHAQAMLAKAQTRAKRATTILRSWKTKTAYYERRLAASKVAS